MLICSPFHRWFYWTEVTIITIHEEQWNAFLPTDRYWSSSVYGSIWSQKLDASVIKTYSQSGFGDLVPSSDPFDKQSDYWGIYIAAEDFNTSPRLTQGTRRCHVINWDWWLGWLVEIPWGFPWDFLKRSSPKKIIRPPVPKEWADEIIDTGCTWA